MLTAPGWLSHGETRTWPPFDRVHPACTPYRARATACGVQLDISEVTAHGKEKQQTNESKDGTAPRSAVCNEGRLRCDLRPVHSAGGFRIQGSGLQAAHGDTSCVASAPASPLSGTLVPWLCTSQAMPYAGVYAVPSPGKLRLCAVPVPCGQLILCSCIASTTHFQIRQFPDMFMNSDQSGTLGPLGTDASSSLHGCELRWVNRPSALDPHRGLSAK